MQPQKDSSWKKKGRQGWGNVFPVGYPGHAREDPRADGKEDDMFPGAPPSISHLVPTLWGSEKSWILQAWGV